MYQIDPLKFSIHIFFIIVLLFSTTAISITSMARKYDVVIVGSTGFTGKLVAEYISKTYPTLNWAIVGIKTYYTYIDTYIHTNLYVSTYTCIHTSLSIQRIFHMYSYTLIYA